MSAEIIVALIGLGGSAIGSLIGIFANSKLIDYRPGAIERKLDEHNQLVSRMYADGNESDTVITNNLTYLQERLI